MSRRAHPLISLAERDARLRKHHAYLCFARMVDALGDVERPVYVLSWARTLNVDRRTFQRALRVLVATGYIEQSGTEGQVGSAIVYRYRLGTCARVDAIREQMAA